MSKYLLHHIEFYITNVCNLTCSDCRTFNNFDLKGRYKFNANQIEPWTKLLDLNKYTIMGGEPTLHPELFDWMEGLAELWPNVQDRHLVTNGTYLSQVKGLHQMAARHKYTISISIHSQSLRPLICEQILKTFGVCELLPIQKNNKFRNQLELVSHMGVKIILKNSEHFQASPFQDNSFTLHDSDPKLAHKNCNIKNCHHMIDGKLYKCGFMATAQTFLRQYKQPIPKLLSDYEPLTADCVTSQDVLDNFQTYIDQCKFCRQDNPVRPLTSTLKKNRTIKIHSQW